MYYLNDKEAETINGGLVGPITINVATTIPILAQTAVSLNTAVLGGKIFNVQGQFAGMGVFA